MPCSYSPPLLFQCHAAIHLPYCSNAMQLFTTLSVSVGASVVAATGSVMGGAVLAAQV
jgi:hypothetical protein